MQLVLSGKLRPPPVSDYILPRVRLIDRLLSARQRLILVQSPAGYGKSILLSQWFNARSGLKLNTAWVSFDSSDANTQTVLTYIVYALQESGLDLKALQNVMSNPLRGLAAEEVVLTLCGHLEKSNKNTLLILEDLHYIESPEINSILDVLIKRSPENFQLAISSRDFPSFSISALRAQEELLELTSRDLQFIGQEIGEFLQLDSADEELSFVEDQTEGWAIALQLMRLHRRDGRKLPKSLAQLGTIRKDIADYLTHQVLESLSEDRQAFLIDTAFLDRICSGLSDTILGRHDSERIFEELKSLNGLLDPIEEDHVWYRHHSLLTDYLRRLLQRKGEDYLATLHRRACRWFADNHFVFDAIKHAVQAGDSELVANLFEKVGGPNIGWQQGFEPLQRILSSIPPEWIDQHPSLKIGQAMIFANEGEIDQAKKLLAEVRSQADENTDSNILHYARTLRLILVGYVDYCNLDAEIEETERAGEEAPASDLWLQGWVYSSLWLLYFRRGKFSAARMAALTATEKLGKAHAFYSQYHAYLDLGIISIARGKLKDTLRYYDHAEELTHQHYATDTSLMKVVQLLSADVYYQRNEMDTACELLDGAIDQLDQLIVQSEVCVNCYITAVNITYTRDGLDPALALLDRADDFAEKRRMLPLQWLALLQRAKLLVNAGELMKAQQFIEEHPRITQFKTLKEQNNIGWREYETAFLLLARLYLYQGKPRTAFELLNSTLLVDEPANRTPFQIEFYTLKAEILTELGEDTEAVDALLHALEEAMKENLVRPLLNEGARLSPHLKLLIKNKNTLGLEATLVDFSLDIIKQIEATSENTSSLFTQREFEILEKITEGKPNKVIANEFDISVSTVKFHLANIFEKLGVQNRTQAVSAMQNRMKD